MENVTYRLFPEEVGSFVHLLRYVYPEGTAGHATATVGTL